MGKSSRRKSATELTTPASLSSSSSHASGSSSSSSSIYDGCRYVHVDKDWCPGTIKLQAAARKYAIENDCPEYSEEIGKEIVKELGGLKFYRSVNDDDDDSSSSSDSSSDSDSDSSSSSSDDSSKTKGEYGFGCYTEKDDVDIDDRSEVEKLKKKKLHQAIRPFYEGERFLVQSEADDRDVYFAHPNHPGTRAFVRASQLIVLRRGTERPFDDRAFKRMRRLLYDSRFFVGRAPNAEKPDDDTRYRIFKARYEFDRHMARTIEVEEREPRPIPGTIWIRCRCCAHNDPDKKHCATTLAAKPCGILVLVILGIIAFGFIYVFIWFFFKTVVTLIYNSLGVSISFLMDKDGPEDDVEGTIAL